LGVAPPPAGLDPWPLRREMILIARVGCRLPLFWRSELNDRLSQAPAGEAKT